MRTCSAGGLAAVASLGACADGLGVRRPLVAPAGLAAADRRRSLEA